MSVGDDDNAISTGNEQRHPLLPSPGRVPKLKGDTCLQWRGGEAGRARSWWNKESWKDHGTWTSGCVQIAKLISLQGTKQISIGPEYGSSRLQQYVLLLPSSWELIWVCKLRKNLPKGMKKQGVEAEEQPGFQPRYSRSGN